MITFLGSLVFILVLERAVFESSKCGPKPDIAKCNVCKCVEDQWACTRKICDPVPSEKDQSSLPPTYWWTLTPCIQPLLVGCRNCQCIDSTWACDVDACYHKSEDGKLAVEDECPTPIPDNCTCKCYNGKWTCKTIDCTEEADRLHYESVRGMVAILTG